VNARDLSMQQRHLLTHAAAMGEWLSGDYVNSYQRAMDSLLYEHGLFETTMKDRRLCYQLTDAGKALAAELGGAR
jgi:hypothetical protein